MESLLKKDKLFARVVLWALTEIKGPISFNLLNKICYVMYMTKKFEKIEIQGIEPSKPFETSTFDEAAQFTVRERSCETETMQLESTTGKAYPLSVRESIPTLETQGDKNSIQEEKKVN